MNWLLIHQEIKRQEMKKREAENLFSNLRNLINQMISFPSLNFTGKEIFFIRLSLYLPLLSDQILSMVICLIRKRRRKKREEVRSAENATGEDNKSRSLYVLTSRFIFGRQDSLRDFFGGTEKRRWRRLLTTWPERVKHWFERTNNKNILSWDSCQVTSTLLCFLRQKHVTKDILVTRNEMKLKMNESNDYCSCCYSCAISALSHDIWHLTFVGMKSVSCITTRLKHRKTEGN